MSVSSAGPAGPPAPAAFQFGARFYVVHLQTPSPASWLRVVRRLVAALKAGEVSVSVCSQGEQLPTRELASASQD